MKERKDTTHHKKAGELMTPEEELEEGVVDSMDASDPPSLARKGDDGHAVPSSGYKPEDWEEQDEGTETEENAKKRSEEHTSELQSLMRISYAVFCLKKKKETHTKT